MRASFLIATILSYLALLVACGGARSTATPTKTPDPSPTATSTQIAQPTPTPASIETPTLDSGRAEPAKSDTPSEAESAENRFEAGLGLQEQGRWEEAVAEYDEAIRLHPQPAEAYRNRGAAYFRLGQYQRAIQDYDQAIRVDPQDSKTYVGRAVAYTLIGKESEAQRDVDRAVELGFDRGSLEGILEEAESHR